MKVLNSSRVALIVIASIFLLPLVLAWLMFSGVIDYRPTATRNLGQLVAPTVPVSWRGANETGSDTPLAEVFGDHWLVLHAVPRGCDEACLEAVSGLRQVHLAAGRDRDRIRLALLHRGEDPEGLRRIYDAFHLVENPDGTLWRILERVAEDARPPADAPGGTYLIDPLGNIMMFYAAGTDPNDLKKDLKSLLTWSKQDHRP